MAIDGGKDGQDDEARQSAPVCGRDDGGKGAVGVHGDEEEEADKEKYQGDLEKRWDGGNV